MSIKSRQLLALRRRPKSELAKPIVNWANMAAQYMTAMEEAKRTNCAILVAPPQPEARVLGRTQLYVHLDEANFRVLRDV